MFEHHYQYFKQSNKTTSLYISIFDSHSKTNQQTPYHSYTMSSLATGTKTTPSRKPRVRFDEEGIAVDYAERGVLYGTQKIDQPDTPYIYYDSEEDDYSAQIMVAEYSTSGEPQRMMASQLQEKLGLIAQQQEAQQQTKKTTNQSGGDGDGNDQDSSNKSAPVTPLKKWEQAEKRMDFESKRRQLYAQEGTVFAQGPQTLNEHDDEDIDLPEGWVSLKSRSDGAKFYYNAMKDVTTWKRPE